MKLYEITETLKNIDSVLESATDAETMEILESARESVLESADNKIENILEFIADCNAQVAKLDERLKVLAQKKKTLESKSKYLKSLVFAFMKDNNIQKETYGDYTCTVAKNPAKVVMTDVATAEQFLPREFLRVKTEFDLTAIKQAMFEDRLIIDVNGEQVEIAHLEQGESLKIK